MAISEKSKRNRGKAPLASAIALALFFIGGSGEVFAQTGVDDDRVSLPEGPGSLEGVGENIEIDPNMGSMRYSVPIEVPRGINGMTPSVGLNYSSSGGSSVLGVGWSMPEMSIERMTMRGTPEYDNEDYFAANGGEELVLVDAGNDSQVYRERFEGSFVRYTWHDVGAGEDGYWTAEYPDGSIGYFGADSLGNLVDSARSERASGGTYKYHMVEKVDPYGHSLRYEYDKLTSNKPLVSSISYLFDPNSNQPVYQVRFDYEERQDLLSDAGAGYEELLEHRLTSVQVISRSEIIREYTLAYEDYADAGGFSRLNNVKKYGRGGAIAGKLYPIEFTFGYSNALGVECQDANCDKPYLVNMGTAQGATGLANGKATLLDINADGLPDILDTTEASAHKILINRISLSGDILSHGFESPAESAMGTGSNFGLGNNITQVLDVNGDGLSDLINANSGATLLAGYGNQDWAEAGSPIDATVLQSLDISSAKFLDYNNDKRIDLMTSDGSNTVIYENQGDSFAAKTVDNIGVPLADTPTVQLSDMNGDGNNDVVEVLGDGAVRYKLNYGWGKWSGWKNTAGVQVQTSERELVDLEDLNGDGISDIVVVTATQVKYAINRNGDQFDDFVVITSSEVEGELPERKLGDKVLYADMNANGSDDVVWFDATGEVKYLELFPKRPNLLSRIENGIGMVQTIEYTTSALQEAAAREAGNAWNKTLSIPMNIVASTDTYVTLTGSEDGSGLHEKVSYTYRDGYYDGVEKQFRGFEMVSVEVQSSDAQEGGTTTMRYNVGQGAPHFNGLLMSQTIRSGDRVIREETNTYDVCDLDGVPTPVELAQQGRFGIYFPCKLGETTVIQEGAPQADWITTQTDYQYDGWGNITLTSNLGVVGVDGDELFTETIFNDPEASSRYFVGLPLEERTWAVPGGSIKNEYKTYYDGEDFVGSQANITHGFVSRKTTKVDEGKVIDSSRQRRDEHGNVVESIDPNGSLQDESSHRRDYFYDELGLFLTYLDIHIDEERTLRRSTQYEYDFQKLIDVTDWVLIQGGSEVSPRNSKHYEYDDFGRITEEFEPGDADDKPSIKFIYELGDPFSRVTIQGRSERNGPSDEAVYRCFDGRGKLYQTRTKTDEGDYLVTGFTVFNSRGAIVEQFQPYSSDSGECERERPAGVLSSLTSYDALFRQISTSEPGEDIYGERLLSRTEYLPLKEINYDHEDLDPSSPHADTPTITYADGVDRPVAKERTLAGGEVARYELHYDETGSFSGYTDAGGNRHELVVDLAGRITAVRNATTGEATFEYDDAGNITSMTDSRGVTTKYAYDGGNRQVAIWDAADEEGSKIAFHYDTVPTGCDLTECTNPANRLAAVTYPTIFGQGMDRIGYDSRQRIVFQGRRLGDVIDISNQVSFDNMNRPISNFYPDGNLIEREYDDLGRVVSVKGFIDGITYSPRGFLDTISYANAASAESRYDALGRLESRINKDGAGAIIEGLVFERDREGNLLAIEDMTEREDPGHESKFEYDAWYRLVKSTQEADGQNDTMTYAFDRMDRILSVTSSLDAASAAHVGDIDYDESRPLAVKSAGELALEFDATGQVTQRGGLSLEWDFMNRITTASKNGAQEMHVYGAKKYRTAIVGEDRVVFYGFGDFEVRDGVSHTYIRPQGDRLAKTTSTTLMTSIYEDLDEDNTITAADAWLLEQRGEEGVIGTAHTLGAAAARMLAEDGEDRVFFHTDHMSNLVSATDLGGEVVGKRAFNNTGVLRYEVGYVDVYGFTGQEHNDFTNLIQFKMRDFDPVIARWTSFDPAFVKLDAAAMGALGDATTGYAYVSNNFANMVDPHGLSGKASDAAKSSKSGKQGGEKALPQSSSGKAGPESKPGSGSGAGGDIGAGSEGKSSKAPIGAKGSIDPNAAPKDSNPASVNAGAGGNEKGAGEGVRPTGGGEGSGATGGGDTTSGAKADGGGEPVLQLSDLSKKLVSESDARPQKWSGKKKASAVGIMAITSLLTGLTTMDGMDSPGAVTDLF